MIHTPHFFFGAPEHEPAPQLIWPVVLPIVPGFTPASLACAAALGAGAAAAVATTGADVAVADAAVDVADTVGALVAISVGFVIGAGGCLELHAARAASVAAIVVKVRSGRKTPSYRRKPDVT